MSHYSVLGLQPNATQAEVKKSYKRLAIKYHPDKSQDPKHHEMFVEIKNAYETLSDPESRNKYDKENNIYQPYRQQQPAATTSYTTTHSHGGNGGMSSFFSYTTSNTTSTNGYAEIFSRFTSRDGWNSYRSRAQQEQELAEKLARQQQEAARREVELRIRRGAQLREMREQARKFQEEQRREVERQEEERRARLAQYELQKQEAYRNAHNPGNGGPRRRKGSSNDPIVLSDDEEDEVESDIEITAETVYQTFDEEEDDDEEDEYEDAEENGNSYKSNGYPSSQTATNSPYGSNGNSQKQNVKEEPQDGELKSALEDYLASSSNMKIRERQQPPFYKRYTNGDTTSPRRYTNHGPPPTTEAPISNVRGEKVTPQAKKNHNKKAKLGVFEDLGGMSESLDSAIRDDFGEKPLSDLLNSLPVDSEDNEPRNSRRRAASSNLARENANKGNKRAKYDFIGERGADTLHRPVNGTSYKAHSTYQYSMLDLGADPEILNAYPPTAPNLSMISNADIAIAAMHKYRKAFSDYSKVVLQYQYDRTKKDEELSSTIYSSESTYRIYSQCLLQDSVVAERFSKATNENAKVFKEFQKYLA